MERKGMSSSTELPPDERLRYKRLFWQTAPFDNTFGNYQCCADIVVGKLQRLYQREWRDCLIKQEFRDIRMPIRPSDLPSNVIQALSIESISWVLPRYVGFYDEFIRRKIQDWSDTVMRTIGEHCRHLKSWDFPAMLCMASFELASFWNADGFAEELFAELHQYLSAPPKWCAKDEQIEAHERHVRKFLLKPLFGALLVIADHGTLTEDEDEVPPQKETPQQVIAKLVREEEKWKRIDEQERRDREEKRRREEMEKFREVDGVREFFEWVEDVP